ncbi:MAG: DinB family protein [Hymenobacteraceae bacterium]|nr:DinB family protein [Hymenobacteraceae bacterium]MDX5396222.1 DinB family protein [Hymenobacteraceae bacterium]MDX5444178.1 DinB family protein [Hymenobacteraceae bacterium]MDX5512285.1 DinB family protein [Hymenobacteraceae bacterium]
MSVMDLLAKELEQEAQTTRKMLERIPDNKYDWQPHEKNMTIRQLASHIAELPSWVEMTFNTSELDFAANPYTLPQINNTAELLAYFEKNLESGKAAFATAREEQLSDEWTLREGETVYMKSSKYHVLRMSLSQIIHHRAQLGVYLRLLNIPVPGSYGPSADDNGF